MRHILLLALASAACTSNLPAAGGSGGATLPGPSGGPVGSSCPAEGAVACAPGGGQKVRCAAGVWSDDGGCATGTSCVETKANGAVVATACVVKPSGHSELGLACAKVLSCTDQSNSSMDQCVNGSLHADQIRALYQKIGLVLDLDNAVQYDLLGRIGCLASAKTCADVGICLAGNVKCAAGVKSGCTGTMAWKCQNDVPMALDCAALNLQCAIIDKDALCGLPVACSGPKGVTCNGDTATLCVKDGAGFVGAQVKCGGVGMGCDATVGELGCAPKNAVACDSASFVAHCEGNVRVKCSKGKVAQDDCSLTGEQCAVTTLGDGTKSTQCTYGAGCTGSPKCDGSRLSYCESGSRVSIDCAAGGMICDASSGNGFCKFSP